MSQNYNQIEQFIERLYSNFANCEGATRAFMMCAAHESKGGYYILQEGHENMRDYGRGIVQIQQNLHDDILFQISKAYSILDEYGYTIPRVDNCVHDIKYSALIFRLHFMRYSHKFPTDLNELGDYLKKYWNSEAGKATGEKYVNDFLEWKRQ